MKAWTLALVLVLAGCGSDTSPSSKSPKTGTPGAKTALPPHLPAAKEPVIQGDPAAKYLCLQCGLRTNDKACPKCKTVLAADTAPAPKTAPGDVGKSNLAPTYACPKEGCKYTSARKEKCLKHEDTDLKEVWYTCAKDAAGQTAPGKCAKCGGDLARELR